MTVSKLEALHLAFQHQFQAVPTSNSLMELVSLWRSGSLWQFQEKFLTLLHGRSSDRKEADPTLQHQITGAAVNRYQRYKHQNFRNGHKAAVHVNLIAKPAAVSSRLVSNSHRKTTRCQAGQFACHGRCRNYNHCTTCYGPQLHWEFHASTWPGPIPRKGLSVPMVNSKQMACTSLCISTLISSSSWSYGHDLYAIPLGGFDMV